MSRNRTIVATRVERGPPATDEITALAEAAGHAVLEECTQTGPEDSGTYLGAGKIETLATLVAETGANAVVVDNELTPAQHHALAAALPDGTRVLDRYRLVLEIFGEQADSRRAKLQVELAELRYDLPRMEASADEGWLNKRVEKGSPIYDARDRIDGLQRKLDALPDPSEEFRRRRREDGFDLVTVAGYTNAGKSTLLHRLADDLALDNSSHPDRDETASIADRLFETLETTTRRATLGGRPVLLTDTVGFVADLPHWLVESFNTTLSEAAAADCVVLVVDASDPPADLREKLGVSLGVLDAQGIPRERVVTALNKVDRLDPNDRDRALATAAELVDAPIPTSVLAGTGVERLVERVLDRLPRESATVEVPNGDDAMALVSWCYDHADVADVTYENGRVTVAFAGRPSIIERARAKADAIEAGTRR